MTEVVVLAPVKEMTTPHILDIWRYENLWRTHVETQSAWDACVFVIITLSTVRQYFDSAYSNVRNLSLGICLKDLSQSPGARLIDNVVVCCHCRQCVCALQCQVDIGNIGGSTNWRQRLRQGLHLRGYRRLKILCKENMHNSSFQYCIFVGSLESISPLSLIFPTCCIVIIVELI